MKHIGNKIVENGKMVKTAFFEGDSVFRLDDLKKEFPIRISSMIKENDEILYRGCFANARGRMVYKKFRESELIPAK